MSSGKRASLNRRRIIKNLSRTTIRRDWRELRRQGTQSESWDEPIARLLNRFAFQESLQRFGISEPSRQKALRKVFKDFAEGKIQPQEFQPALAKAGGLSKTVAERFVSVHNQELLSLKKNFFDERRRQIVKN